MAAKKLSETFSKNLMVELQKWGRMKRTGVSLRYMMKFGSKPTEKNLLISAQFLHKELAIRIARRALELEKLPYGLSEKPAVLKVRDWYLDSFRDVRSFQGIKDSNDELAFTKTIKTIKLRHKHVAPTMALGVQQLKKDLDSKTKTQDLIEIHQFLDRFFMSRIGIRMLIGQHVALHDPNPQPDCIGFIHTRMSPMEVARNASEDARSICLREYGSAPDVNIYGDPNFTFPYVPPHLHLMVFELVKNSLRAVQERYMDSDQVAPPIRIIVADGIEDVTIKISDEGGGIPRRGLQKLFTYLYSTAKNPLDENLNFGSPDAVTMAGYGCGLPICRLYARYFGGDLQVISMEGYVREEASRSKLGTILRGQALTQTDGGANLNLAQMVGLGPLGLRFDELEPRLRRSSAPTNPRLAEEVYMSLGLGIVGVKELLNLAPSPYKVRKLIQDLGL
ncbi:Histidine kinase-like ATPase [Macleaya cordata]|uniref:Protein-serine/threonine kinase n=1 Tax=Macleaya cordata TaxID=56857 RepID=A0A200R1V7_MACCD|nr:Histidine kinase-like ATPase [Macleaya cordata]